MLPEITHLQFVILAALAGGEQPGQALRRKLSAVGEGRIGPAFYQMMARLEAAGLVHGHYEQQIVEGQIFRERYYRATARGIGAHRQTCDFYRRFVAREKKSGPPPA